MMDLAEKVFSACLIGVAVGLAVAIVDVAVLNDGKVAEIGLKVAVGSMVVVMVVLAVLVIRDAFVEDQP